VSTGLIALLDDIAGLAKVAAASLDDIGAQAAKSGAKAAGIVIDDAAVTPRYVVGFAADRELPIIWRIAVGSLKNKLLYLLPAALILSFIAPWAITPLLMLGGLFLCYEGAEKIYELVFPHAAHEHEDTAAGNPRTPQELEDQKIKGAIKTDFILSAEIMAITLSTVADRSIWIQALVLAAVGLGITVTVYGAVALIVKADDAGVSLATNPRPASTLLGLRAGSANGVPSGGDRAMRPVTQGLGRALVYGMPIFMKVLSIIGTAAMLWVGGGIVVHGLEEFGITGPGHLIHDAAVAVGHGVPAMAGFLEWLVSAAASGVVGLVLGALVIPFVHYIAAPAWHGVVGAKKAAH
jgi:predicted DNA repair protein MutK